MPHTENMNEALQTACTCTEPLLLGAVLDVVTRLQVEAIMFHQILSFFVAKGMSGRLYLSAHEAPTYRPMDVAFICMPLSWHCCCSLDTCPVRQLGGSAFVAPVLPAVQSRENPWMAT